jgi:endoribonuclease Dicer
MTCYERLEFLGDAILDFCKRRNLLFRSPDHAAFLVVIQHIFDLHGQLSPGALTLLKACRLFLSTSASNDR